MAETAAGDNIPGLSPPARKRRFLRKRYWMPLVILVGWYFLQPANRMRELRAAAKGADHVRIVLYAPEQSQRKTVTIPERAKVDEFLDTVSLTSSLVSCACAGTMEIQLARGDDVLVKLNYAGEKLLWIDGRWHSDGFLTADSSERLRAWIDTNGGSELAKARAEVRKLWADWRAREEREAAESMPASDPATEPADEVFASWRHSGS